MSLLVNRASHDRVSWCSTTSSAPRRPLVRWPAGSPDGRLVSREDIVEGGSRTFPEALLKLFTGENMGKLVLEVA